MSNDTRIAVDVAKAVFEIGISDRPGHVSRRERLPRALRGPRPLCRRGPRQLQRFVSRPRVAPALPHSTLYRVSQPPTRADEHRDPVHPYLKVRIGMAFGFTPRSTQASLQPLTH
jgi:hypothetical protein